MLPGVTVGNRCIIGAGTIISSSIPDNSVAVGNPCKVICSNDEYMQRYQNKISDGKVLNKYPRNMREEKVEIREMTERREKEFVVL